VTPERSLTSNAAVSFRFRHRNRSRRDAMFAKCRTAGWCTV